MERARVPETSHGRKLLTNRGFGVVDCNTEILGKDHSEGEDGSKAIILELLNMNHIYRLEYTCSFLNPVAPSVLLRIVSQDTPNLCPIWSCCILM